MKRLIFRRIFPLILLSVLFTLPVLAQKTVTNMHHEDSCNVPNCRRWHYIRTVDEETKENVLTVYKYHTKRKYKNWSDARVNYKHRSCQYYETGKIHKTTVQKGYTTGWRKKEKGTVEWFDTDGRLIKKELQKKNKIIEIEYDTAGHEIKRTEKQRIRAKF